MAEPGHIDGTVGKALDLLDEIASLVRTADVFEPDRANVEIYRRLGGRLRQSFKQTRPIFKALAERRP